MVWMGAMVPCMELSRSCRLDWAALSAVGTLAAAGATVWAIVVALTSAERDYRRRLSMREEEWKREADALAARTARLAHAFGQELTRAGKRLSQGHDALKFALTAARTKPGAVDLGVELLAQGMEGQSLPLMERFADDLDGLKELDGIAVLNVLSNWRYVTSPMPVLKEVNLSEVQKRQQIELRMAEFRMVVSLMRELQIKLEAYYSHLPGIMVVDPKDVPGDELTT